MIIKYDLYSHYLNRQVFLHMYLPDDYMSSQKQYPVLYMFDGHNLFFDEDATYGRSWRLLNHLYALDQEIIVCGMECSHEGTERLSEYAPMSFYDPEFGGNIEGKGELTMKFLVRELKPYVDAHFPSLKDRKHTWIAGSSCGGIMAMYALVSCSGTFSRAAALSPYLTPSISGMLHLIEGSRIHKGSSMYISWGAREGFTAHEFVAETDAVMRCANILLRKGVRLEFNVKPWGLHNEASWEAEADQFLPFLTR